MATQSQIDANRRNAQKSTGPKTPEGKARSCRNGLRHGLTAQSCMLADEDPGGLLDLLEEIREKYDPQDTDEDFLVERMAKARFKYYRIMPLEAGIFNLRLSVDQAPKPLVNEQGDTCLRAWAYMRDANGGNALSKLARYETGLLREYDRSRQELEKLQKIRAAQPVPAELRTEANSPVSPASDKTSSSAQSAARTPEPSLRNPQPSQNPVSHTAAPAPSPDSVRIRDNEA